VEQKVKMPESNNPRVLTQQEVRDQFLTHVAVMIDYWERIPNGGSLQERLEGLVHSLLVALDGNSTALPAFVVAPAPHSSDRQYCIANGENFYPEAPVASCDIAGELHEGIYGVIERLRFAPRDHSKPSA
jgi:hypothetical protein